MSKEAIEKVIARAFTKVQEAYEADERTTERSTLLVFPRYTHSACSTKLRTRMCEQELRFAFAEALCEEFRGTDLSYSIETPTQGRYLLSVSNTSTQHGLNDQLPCISEYGESGCFDLVIYEGKDIAYLIEFKARNPKIEQYAKDLLKLSNPIEDGKEGTGNAHRYFIQLVESSDRLTIRSIRDKLTQLSGEEKYTLGKKPVRCLCYSLRHHSEGKPEGKKIIDLTFPLR